MDYKKYSILGMSIKITHIVDLQFFFFLFFVFLWFIYLIPWGQDIWFHLLRLEDIKTQLESGEWLIYLSNNSANGKGLPVYIFYSQWIYWLPIVLSKFGVSSFLSLKMSFYLFLLLSSYGCYLFLRLHVSHSVAIIGALVYITSNYVLGDIFIRAAYSEFLGYSLLPFMLYTLHKYILENRGLHAIFFVIISSIMILFYPLSFVNVSIAVLFYTLYILPSYHDSLKWLLKIGPLLIFTLLLTSFFWLPALIENKYVLGVKGLQVDPLNTFISIKDYFSFRTLQSLGLLLTLGVILSIFWVLYSLIAKKDIEYRKRAYLVIGIVLYFVLTLPLSKSVWEHAPFIRSNIFVWRLLFPLTLLSVLLLTIFIQSIMNSMSSPIFLLILGGVLIVQGGLVIGGYYLDNSRNLMLWSKNEINSNIIEYSKRANGWGVSEYLPNPEMLKESPSLCQNDSIKEMNLYRESGYNLSFLVSHAQRFSCFQMSYLWNVRYKATIENAQIPINANRHGEMVIFPNGKYGLVSLSFEKPIYLLISEIVSIVSAILLIFITAGLTIRSCPRLSYYFRRI